MSNKETQEQLRNLMNEMADFHIKIGFNLFSKSKSEKANNEPAYKDYFLQSLSSLHLKMCIDLTKLDNLIEKNIENPREAIFEKFRLVENVINVIDQIIAEHEKNNEELDTNYEKLRKKCLDFFKAYDSIVPKKENNE